QHCERMIAATLDREIPRLEAPFDAIVYADVLEHLTDPLRVISDLDRHLAPDGFVIVSVPNIAHLYIRLLLLFGRFDYIDRGILDRTHLRFFTARSLRDFIADAGLVVERFTATPAPLYQDRKSTRLNSSHDQISYAVFCLKKKKVDIKLWRST